MATSVGVWACARAAATIGLPALLVGCSFDAQVGFDDGDAATGTPSVVDVAEIKAGDCFLEDFGEERSRVKTVPCDEVHVYEVYARFELSDGDFPGDAELVRLSSEGCQERFARFAGVDHDETSLEVTYLFPSQESWESADDRAVTCAASDSIRLLQGSVAGAGEKYRAFFAGACTDVQLRIVDCADEHEAEVYLVTEMGGDQYPGDQAVEEQSGEMCVDAFADYVGAEQADSALTFLHTWPDQQMWTDGERTTMCAAYDPGGQLTGSVKDTQR